jgi:hypothetical protein
MEKVETQHEARRIFRAGGILVAKVISQEIPADKLLYVRNIPNGNAHWVEVLEGYREWSELYALEDFKELREVQNQ